jgi:hypothetical protein
MALIFCNMNWYLVKEQRDNFMQRLRLKEKKSLMTNFSARERHRAVTTQNLCS